VEAADPDYRVQLEIFEGPLDLLLYLIKREELDIYDVSIERITKDYLAFMGAFKMLNIELASEFIVMAANLMYIKSRTLLPKNQQPPEEEAEEEDPRWELIRQLVEYKKFKDAAEFLGQREEEEARLLPARPEAMERGHEPPEGDEPPALPSSVGIFDLIRAFQRVLARFEEETTLAEIVDDRFTVGDKIDWLLREIPEGKPAEFTSLFAEATTRNEVIVTFLALLELIKLKHFRVAQERLLGEILIMRQEGH
jgi:segregation and condensation protein A